MSPELALGNSRYETKKSCELLQKQEDGRFLLTSYGLVTENNKKKNKRMKKEVEKEQTKHYKLVRLTM